MKLCLNLYFSSYYDYFNVLLCMEIIYIVQYTYAIFLDIHTSLYCPNSTKHQILSFIHPDGIEIEIGYTPSIPTVNSTHTQTTKFELDANSFSS
jgi:hypothetical protein